MGLHERGLGTRSPKLNSDGFLHLHGFMLRQRALDIHYSVPKENAAEPDLNQGTLVVFNMDSSIPRNQILDLFSQFGEVKEIRATPKKEGHKFVEFYDSRHAHAALQGASPLHLFLAPAQAEIPRLCIRTELQNIPVMRLI